MPALLLIKLIGGPGLDVHPQWDVGIPYSARHRRDLLIQIYTELGNGWSSLQREKVAKGRDGWGPNKVPVLAQTAERAIAGGWTTLSYIIHSCSQFLISPFAGYFGE